MGIPQALEGRRPQDTARAAFQGRNPGTEGELRTVALPARFTADLTHIALATLAEVDALVSWNFKHIVRLEKIRLFNAANVELGLRTLTILSPREVTTHEGH
jgi:hypothetical protein